MIYRWRTVPVANYKTVETLLKLIRPVVLVSSIAASKASDMDDEVYKVGRSMR